MARVPPSPERERQIPTALWVMLGVLLVAVFAAAVIILGEPAPILTPSTPEEAVQSIQAPPDTTPSR